MRGRGDCRHTKGGENRADKAVGGYSMIIHEVLMGDGVVRLEFFSNFIQSKIYVTEGQTSDLVNWLLQKADFMGFSDELSDWGSCL